MIISNKINETRKQIKEWKKQGYSIGFVATMGYLHEGHQSLIERSIQECDKTIVSIFVNPIQFAPNEDLSTYPRDLNADSTLCEKCGADLIFAPTAEEMYSENFCTFVDMNLVTKELCGKSRPTHFRGVCTVVNKLFNIVAPDKAYFGQKDAQQLAVIKRMVRDLSMDIEVVGCPIIREDDGLAKSSRNTYLSPEERKASLVLSQSLEQAKSLLNSGEVSCPVIIDSIRKIIENETLAKIDYIEIVDADNIEKIDTVKESILIALAVYIGKTRLIDNIIWDIKE